MSTSTAWAPARQRSRFPRWLLIPLAIAAVYGAFALYGLLFRDSRPALGSQLTFSQTNAVCTDVAGLTAFGRASLVRDQIAIRQLTDSGQCWADGPGTTATVTDRGTMTLQDGQRQTVQLRLGSGPHARSQGWAYVPPNGL